MSNHHFHRSAGPLTIFTILLFHFHSVLGRGFCISGNVRGTLASLPSPRAFLHLGRPTFSRGFCASRTAFFACRLTFFACRAANPTRPPHPSIFQRFFCISDSLFCMSAHVFCMSSRQSYTSAAPQHFPEVFFASRTAFFACRLTFFACRAANPTRPPHPGIFQRFFCISDSLFCMSAHVFCMSSRQSYTSAAPQHVP